MDTSTPMLRDLDSEVVVRLRQHLRSSTTHMADAVRVVAPEAFTDPALAARERDEVFGRVPFIVAHGSELPNAHDFVTVDLPRNRALVVRQADGSVRAFLNVCRHRGAMLESEASGSCRVISCPYHGWSYNPDGSLRQVTYDATFGEVERAHLGLIELPAEERHGFIWLVDSPGVPIDVAAHLGSSMDDLLRQHGLDDFVCYRSGSFYEPANWKIMQDAFLDGYHIKYAHANSAGGYIHTNVSTYEDHGRHALFGSPRKSIDQWIDADPDDGTTLRDHISVAHFLFPNCTLLRQPDHFQVLSFFPDPQEPGKSRMEMRLVVPRLEASGLDEAAWTRRWDKNWDILMAVLRDEDFPLLRDQQVALSSEDAGPLVLGRNEIANQHFHRELERQHRIAST